MSLTILKSSALSKLGSAIVLGAIGASSASVTSYVCEHKNNNKLEQTQETTPSQFNGAQVPELIKKIRPRVVRIITSDNVFSGFIFRDNNDNSYILSCGHGISSEDKYKKETYKILNYNNGPYDEYIEFDGAPYFFENGKPAYLSHKDGDMMLLKPLTDKKLQALKFRDASIELEQGTPLFMLGSPHGIPNTLSHGFSGLYREVSLNKGPLQLNLQIDGALEPGRSGEPSVDINGDVVAMNTWKMDNQGMKMDIGFFAVSAISIQAWLESNGISVIRNDSERDTIKNWMLSLEGKGDKNLLRLNHSWPEEN